MSLQSQVLGILRGPVVPRIRFIFPAPGGNVTIAPQTFHFVAHAIEGGRIHVAVPTDLAAGVAAQYNDVARTRADGTQVRANTLEVNSPVGRLTEGHVLHESLHAAYDLMRTGINADDEESSAYVVSSLYLRMTGVRPPRWNAEPYVTAGRVANTLLTQYARGTTGIPTVGVAEWSLLKVMVMMNPVYMFPWSSAGNFSFGPAFTGGSYTHDG